MSFQDASEHFKNKNYELCFYILIKNTTKKDIPDDIHKTKDLLKQMYNNKLDLNVTDSKLLRYNSIRNKNEYVYFHIAKILFNRKKYHKSIYTFQIIVENYTELVPESCKEIGRNYERLNKFEKAIEYYKKHIDSYTAYKLGFIYDSHFNDKKNALKYYTMSRYGLAKYNVSLIYREIGDSNLAFKYAKESADMNISEAQYIVGHYYHFGIGTYKNFEQALRYYKMSAENGSEKSKLAVSKLDYTNKELILRYLKELLDSTNKEIYCKANYNLGYFYDKENIDDLAIDYYTRCLEYCSDVIHGGTYYATCCALASIYENKDDHKKAYDYYTSLLKSNRFSDKHRYIKKRIERLKIN